MLCKMSEPNTLSLGSLERQKFEDIEEQIQPLDLLLFRGKDFVSRFIRFLEAVMLGNGTFSHCGIVVDRELMPWHKKLKPGVKYVWESTMSISIGNFTDGMVDVETGKGKLGVQIRPLRKVIKAYTNEKKKAHVAWAPIKDSPWTATQKKEVQKIIRKLHKEVGMKTYELNPIELLGSLFPMFRCLRRKTEWFEDEVNSVLTSWDIIDESDTENADAFYFCSELVAELYKRVGILNDPIDPSTVLPMDFLGYDQDGIDNITKQDPIILLV